MLNIAVVGHTNTGKTSLLRTLTRDASFGEVADAPGTTRQVQQTRVMVDGKPVIALFDTPGIEDSMGLLDYLERLVGPNGRMDGLDRIQAFLRGPEAQNHYEQEARVIRQLLDCDAGLYVIDARDPVMAKHRDELVILGSCGKPLMPVLNFVASPRANIDAWRDALARAGLHSLIEFDSVSPPIDGEQTLWSHLSILLSRHARTFEALAAQANRQRQARHHAGLDLIASLLIDAASARTISASDDAAVERALSAQQAMLRDREARCVSAMLSLFQFRQDDVLAAGIPLTDGRWKNDLFEPEALKEMGIHLSKGMAAGAIAGATVDVLSAGLSLGTGTLIGAAAGGAWQGIERWGNRLIGQITGKRELTVDDQILELLLTRQLFLLQALERRGHAATTPLRLEQQQPVLSSDPDTLAILKSARAHPEWSGLNPGNGHHASRQDAIHRLVDRLHYLSGHNVPVLVPR